MSGTAKRKTRAPSTEPQPKRICIVHNTDCNHEHFTYLCNAKDPDERFRKLQEIRESRMRQPRSSAQRMEDVCCQIPETFTEEHGYHRDCYQKFTKNLERLKQGSDTPSTSHSRRRSMSQQQDKQLFHPDCIFCNKEGGKKIKKKGTWTTEDTMKFEFGGDVSVKNIAEANKDEKLLLRISGVDLFAVEAVYHPTCRKNYTRNPKHRRSEHEEERIRQQELEEAHEMAFSEVKKLIDRHIIAEQQIMKLTDLRQVYVDTLDNTKFPNKEYRSSKLKMKIIKNDSYKNKLLFTQLDNTRGFNTCLICRNDIDLSEAVKYVYKLVQTDTVKEVGQFLHDSIIKAFESSERLPWPPIVENLSNIEDVVPEDLQTFLQLLMFGTNTRKPSGREARLILSVGQDICRAATHGQWKLPKHILLCMTLRHLYRSSELTVLLNRLGHSESYSFSLEVETAIAAAVEQTSSYLSSQIVRNPKIPSIFHSDFDNFDQFVNSLTGQGSVHTANGIMLQDFETEPTDHGGTLPKMPSVARSCERSLNSEPERELPECYITKRKSPSFNITLWEDATDSVAMETALMKNLLWIMVRLHSSRNDQDVPGWAGYMSLIGKKPACLSTIDYYPVINHPITDNKTVQEVLRYSEEATREVGQRYVITTFDLGVCMKAFPIVWNDPARYENHIIMIGTFHLICAYLKMVGKKMDGTGMSDIFQEAGLISSGSLNGVLNGKNYSRAMNCHKILLETLERLLFQQFMLIKEENKPFGSLSKDSYTQIKDFIDSTSKEGMNEIEANAEISNYIKNYEIFKDEVRSGNLGKTAQLWVSYIDHIWFILALTQAVKTNDFVLYKYCIYHMCDIFFALDGQNYARYLTFFAVFMTNVEDTHPGAEELLKRGAISVARSFIPGNRAAVDKTIEETFMKHAKSKAGAVGRGAGVSGLVNNYDAYQRWVRSTHQRSMYVEAAFNMADMLGESSGGKRHKDLRPTEIRKSEKGVIKTVDAVQNFVNPFTVDDKNKLYCISSGAPATERVAIDVMSAEIIGKRTKETFIKERLEEKDNFFQPIPKLKLKRLSDMNITAKVKTSQNKTVEYKQQGNIAFQLLVHSQEQEEKLDLKELMAYSLTPVPHSIGTADGFLFKTDKTKGYHNLIKDVDDANVPPNQEILVIQDGNALFHQMRDIQGNFKQIAKKIFEMVSYGSDVIFSTDMYQSNSVKSMERLRRGTSDKLIVKGLNTKRPNDWKLCLTNDENKEQLIQVLLDAWSSDSFAERYTNRKVVTICKENAFMLTSEDGVTTKVDEIEELCSNQEETDSRVILYCKYAKANGYKYARVKSPDTDIFFICLHYVQALEGITILFDTGSGNKKRLLDISSLASGFTQEYCTALMCLHAYTRCDTTSAFKGIGKVKPLRILQKMPKFQCILAKLGESWDVSAELIEGLEEFTCAMYGKPRFKNVNDLRYCKIRERCGNERLSASKNVDIGTLPPCKSCLIQHIRRANYQVGIWRNAHVQKPNIPNATEGHGWRINKGHLEPLWTEEAVLPVQLADVLVRVLEDEEEDDEESSGDESDEAPDDIDSSDTDSD